MRNHLERIKLDQFNTREERVDCLNELAWSLNRSDPRGSIEYSEEALKISIEQSYLYGKACAKRNLSMGYCWLSFYEQALGAGYEGLKLFQTLGDDLNIAQSHYNIGAIYYFLNDMESSLGQNLKSLKFYKSQGHENGVARAYNGIGSTYNKMGDFEKSVEYLEDAAEILERDMDDTDLLIRVYEGLGRAYVSLHELEDGILFGKKCIALAEKEGNKFHHAYALEVIGDAYLRFGEFDVARAKFKESLQIRESIEFVNGILNSRLKIAETILKKGNLDEGIESLHECLVFATETKMEEYQLRIHRSLANIYEERNELSRFGVHLKRAYKLSEQINEKKSLQRSRAIELQLGIERADKLEKADGLKRAKEDSKLLSEIGLKLTSTLDIREVIKILYDHISELMQADCFGIRLINEKTGMVECEFEIDRGESGEGFSFPLDDRGNLTNWCLHNEKEIYISDYEVDCVKYNVEAKAIYGEMPDSLIFQPLLINGKVIGAITTQAYRKHAYKDHHLTTLRTLANYMSIAVANARLYEEMEDQVKLRTLELDNAFTNLKKLNEIGEKITSCLTLKEITEVVYEHVYKIMPSTNFAVGVLSEDEKRLIFRNCIEEGEELPVFYQELADHQRLAPTCFNKGVSLLLNDLPDFSRILGVENYAPSSGHFNHSIIYVPIRGKKGKVGVVSVQSRDKYCYTDNHVQFIENLTNFIAIALENAHLYENMDAEVKKQVFAIEQAREDTKRMSEIGRAITATLDVTEVMRILYENIKAFMPADSFGVRLIDYSKEIVRGTYEVEDGERIEDLEFSLHAENNPSIWCIENKKEIIVNDRHKEYTNYINVPQQLYGNAPQSVLFMPLIARDTVLGVITTQSWEKHAFSENHQNILRTLASYASIAIYNAQLYETMEDKIEDRTAEVVRQKDKIATLDKIGKEITACIDVQEINQTVHDLLKEKMQLDGFGIAEVDDVKNTIGFYGYVENGELLPAVEYDLDNEDYLAVKCFKSQVDILIRNSEDMKKYVKADYSAEEGDDMYSIIYVPLISNRKRLGVITVQAEAHGLYDEEDMSFIKNLAQYIAIAMQNAKSFENMQAISDIGSQVSSSLNLDLIGESLYDSLSQLMDARIFAIGIYNERQGTLTYRKAFDDGDRKHEGLSVEIGENKNLASYCILNRKAVHISSHEEWAKLIDRDRVVVGHDPQSIIMMPLVFENRILGVVTVQSFNEKAYSLEDVEVLKNIGSYLTVGINNIKSFETIELIGEIGKKMTATLELESVLDIFYSYCNRFIEAEVFLLGLYDKETDVLSLDYVYENGERMEPLSYVVGDKQLPGPWAIRNEQILKIDNWEEESHKFSDANKNFTRGKSQASIIYIPLIFQGEVLGVMSVQSSVPNAFTDKDLNFLDSLTSYACVAVHNADTYETLEEINDELDKLSIVASNTDNVVIICSRSGELKWANESFERTYHESLDSYVASKGNKLEDFFEGDINEAILDCIAGKRGVSIETTENPKDRDQFWVQYTLSAVFQEDGTLKNLVLIGSDITSQKLVEHQITEKNKDITDSINYASRIQKSMLPGVKSMNEFMPESFVYFQPRDIVSGDFYWLTKTKDDEIIVAAADCTGHGVPGAFLTIVGNNLLNQIVNINGVTDTAEILTELNDSLLRRFQNKAEGEVKDGMDISICKISNKDAGAKVQFSGAYNSLYYVINNELKEIKADRFAIGTIIPPGQGFTAHEVEIPEGGMLYLFSDGYPDQLGGKKGKKFLKSRFKKLLTDIFEKDPLDQKRDIHENLVEWQGEFSQVDDILVMGIKI